MCIVLCRNRAIHGDVVAVRLLPRPEWRSLNKSLPTGESQKAEIVDGEVEAAVSSAMPSGVVVGILERPERLYVASFDVSGTALLVFGLVSLIFQLSRVTVWIW